MLAQGQRDLTAEQVVFFLDLVLHLLCIVLVFISFLLFYTVSPSETRIYLLGGHVKGLHSIGKKYSIYYTKYGV